MSPPGAVHGGDVFAAARELGRDWTEVLDFSANVNPLGPPPGLKQHLFRRFRLVENYPDPFAWGWRAALAARLDLAPTQVLAGNGTTPLMDLLVRVLQPRGPVIVVPAFAEYEQALTRHGLQARRVKSREQDEFDLTPDLVARVFDLAPDLVFLANPSSPAGRLISPEVLDLVLARARKSGAVLALDEAFLDFTGQETVAGLVKRHRSLIVLHSLTKFFALPGLRLGFLTASPRLARALLAGQEPWSVNALAQAAGLFCLDQEEYAVRTKEVVARERAWLTRALTRVGLGRVVPSAANYLLVKVQAQGVGLDRLVAALRGRGILVRDCASFFGLPRGYLRVAVKGRSANARLVSAIKQILNNGDLK